MPSEIGDIGFPIELHQRDPDTAWVFPMDGTDVWSRTSRDGRPAAYITRDAGTSWQRHDTGLPERGWFTVKRQAMTTDQADPVGVYFGRPAVSSGPAPTKVNRGVASPGTSPRSSRLSHVTPKRLPMNVRIPTPLRSYTDGASDVDANGATLAELLDDLDRRYPGLRFRIVDEQGRIRQHMRILVNRAMGPGLDDPIAPTDEVVLMQALSGG